MTLDNKLQSFMNITGSFSASDDARCHALQTGITFATLLYSMKCLDDATYQYYINTLHRNVSLHPPKQVRVYESY